jgi:protein-S-isoprenylcysteine O-methyltransferase Ste14
MQNLAQRGGWGEWWMAAIMILIVSWFLYRYVAPKGWREWTGAGIVQAFIIALYAEMYGFPVTIYVLTTVFGLKIPWLHPKGHLWATLLGLGYTGDVIEMLIGFAFILLGISLLIEGWREIHQAQRQNRLAMDRLYSVVRHPQYTGIFLALFGQLIHWPTIPTLALFPFIVWIYWRLARKEERAMAERYGSLYLAYRRQVPMFLPRPRNWRRLVEQS